MTADAIRIGDPAVEIRLRRHPRARRMTLRVGQWAEIVMTIPASVSVSRAKAFALDNEGWLRRRLAASRPRTMVAAGVQIPLRGRPVTVTPAESGRVSLRDDTLVLPGPADRVGPRVAAFLREMARQRCAASAEAHAALIGRRPGKLTLRDTRARWGSCTAAGDLMFSWRLAMAPDDVLDYVVAHEVAHLVEMNHSPRFWAVVARLRPDYAASRAWLRTHGSGLMAFDFAPER